MNTCATKAHTCTAAAKQTQELAEKSSVNVIGWGVVLYKNLVALLSFRYVNAVIHQFTFGWYGKPADKPLLDIRMQWQEPIKPEDGVCHISC